MEEPNFDFPALRDAQGKLDAARKRQKQIFEEAGPEMDMAKVKCITGDNTAKVKAIQEAEAEMADLKGTVDGLRGVARAAAATKGHEYSDDNQPEKKAGSKGIGAELARVLPLMAANKSMSQYMDVEMKTNFTRGNTTGWLPFDERQDRVELVPLRPAVQVVDTIPMGSIAFSNYKYMEETTHTAVAAEIDEVGTYQEAAFALTERSKPVQKIGVFVPVSDEQLEDVDSAGQYLRNRLSQQIQRKLDAQVLVGSGTGTPTQLLGTENVSGIQTQALGTDTIPDAAFKLFTLIRSDGFAEPSVGYINPTKWQNVVLERTADGLYIWGHPSVQGPTTLWGVPIVQTVAHTSTKLVAGDYATYSMLFMRRGMDVQITNSHSTFFTSGLQAIRADIRAVMVHFRVKAFGTVTGL